MNLDFGLEPGFSWYVVLLCLSGVVMVAMAAIKSADQSAGSRAISAVAGLGFLGYGIYLGFIFDGGSYWMFFQAFILPVLLVVNFVRAQVAKNQPQQQQFQAQQYPGAPAQQYPGAPAQPQYPAGSTQPPYGAGAAQPQYPAGTTQPPSSGGEAFPQYGPGSTQPQYPAQPQPGPNQPN